MKGPASKRTILKVDLLRDQKMLCFQACMCIYSPEILQAGAVKGLKYRSSRLWTVHGVNCTWCELYVVKSLKEPHLSWRWRVLQQYKGVQAAAIDR